MYAENQEPKPVRLYAKRFYLVTLYDQKQTWGKWENLETTTAKILPGDEAREKRDHYPRWPDMSPNAWAGATLYTGPVYRVIRYRDGCSYRPLYVGSQEEVDTLRAENTTARDERIALLRDTLAGYQDGLTWTLAKMQTHFPSTTPEIYKERRNYWRREATRLQARLQTITDTPAESDPAWQVITEQVQ